MFFIIFSLKLDTACQPDYTKTGVIKAICGTIDFDVNAAKPPNKWGRDLHMFVLGHDGSIFPSSGKQNCEYSTPNWATDSAYGYWRLRSDKCGTEGSTDITGASGEGCAARIMEESWQMNY